MNITFIERNNNLVVKIIGEIDHHTAEEIKNKTEKEYYSSGAKNIVFDFAQVGFMDSSGIGMVIGRYKELQKTNGKVFAINISPAIDRIFTMSGLKTIIPCFNSIEEICED